MAERNTYKQDERLDEPFNIRHLLLASAYIKRYLPKMVLALLISAMGAAAGLLAPIFTQKAIDDAIPNADKPYLFLLGGLLVLVFAVSVLLGLLRSKLMIPRASSTTSARICSHICRSCRSSTTMTGLTARF